jgi:hypothetical protein
MAISFFGGKKQKFYAELDESQVSDSEMTEAPAPAPVVEPSTEEPVAVSAPETPAKAPADKKKKSKKTTAKSEAKKVAPTPAPVSVPVVSKPKVEPTEVAFASQNVLFPTLVRRRPGPSLDAFKAIAKEIGPRR